MVDHEYTDADLAALYELFSPSGPRGDFRFYLPLVMAAGAVLDVGCGTGALLHEARKAGHTGRLCGLDPAPGMLAVARERPDIEWIQGDLDSVAFDREFDLVVMSGHAFQEFVTDEQIDSSLGAIRRALADGGRFAFETRNPLVRAWEGWRPEHGIDATDASGTRYRMQHQVVAPFDGRVVVYDTTYSSPSWDRPKVSRGTLRFLDTDQLAAHLSAARLRIEHQYGGWDAAELTATSPEIITIAVRD